jgi:Zn-dependent M28 family amino/carboxypeptidase
MRGKTLVVLVNDPQVPDPHDPTKLDNSMFKGKVMTYYGRWTYKYEEASAKGAAACLIVHETGPAGYPFAVVAASQGRENFNLGTPSGAAGHVPVEGWLTLSCAKALFEAAGYDFAKLKAAAVRRDFQPIPLGARASFSIQNTIRRVASRNVVARLEGSDPVLRNEYVIYTAHWDHLGRDIRFKPDPVFHGALDNASGGGPAQAQHPVPFGDRRGKGASRFAVLCSKPPLSADEDPGRPQYGRDQRARTDERHGKRRARLIDARRHCRRARP